MIQILQIVLFFIGLLNQDPSRVSELQQVQAQIVQDLGSSATLNATPITITTTPMNQTQSNNVGASEPVSGVTQNNSQPVTEPVQPQTTLTLSVGQNNSFTLTPSNGNVQIDSITGHFSTDTTAYLYSGNTQIQSQYVVNGTARFVNLNYPIYGLQTFTIKTDVDSSLTISPSDITAEDGNGNSINVSPETQ